MSALNRTASPVKGQAYYIELPSIVYATGAMDKTGLEDLAATLYIDGAAGVDSTHEPAEIGIDSGVVGLSLTADEMDCAGMTVEVTTSNAGTFFQTTEIIPRYLAPFAGRYDEQSVLRLEQLLSDLHAFALNEQTDDGEEQTVANPDGSLKMVAAIEEGDFFGTRGKFEGP